MACILFLTEIIDGGEWFSVSRLINALGSKKSKINLDLVAFSSGTIAGKTKYNSIQILNYQNPRSPFKFIKSLLSRFITTRNSLKKLLMEKNINLIISTNYLMLLSAWTLGKKTKLCFWYHGSKAQEIDKKNHPSYRLLLIKMLENLAFLLSNIILVPSKKNQPSRHFKHKIFVLPNIIDKNFFIKRKSKSITKILSKYTIPPSYKNILYVGRIDPYKGLMNLVEAFKLLTTNKEFSKVFLIICYLSKSSDTNLLKILKTKAKNLPVLFIPDRKPVELSHLYQGADLCILPSDQEMAPLSMIESFVSSTPFIGTKTGNMYTELKRIDNRLILTNNSPNEICNALKHFLALNKNDIINIKKNISIRAELYNTSTIIPKFINIIKSAGITI
jgi:glycosyltransferase involved in cell wall biosynthesis